MIKKILKLKVKQLDGTSVPICIRPENYSTMQRLKVIYAQTYKDLIMRGVPTRSSMLDLIKKEGMWGEKEENQFNQIIVELSLLENLFAQTKEKDKQKEIVIKLAKLRNELFEIIQIKSEPLQLVAEEIAEEIKAENYIVESTYFMDGKPYFKDYNDFKDRRYQDDVMKIVHAFSQIINIKNTKTMLDLPENKWMMENGLMSKFGEITDDSLWKEIEDGPKEEVNQEQVVQDIIKEATT